MANLDAYFAAYFLGREAQEGRGTQPTLPVVTLDAEQLLYLEESLGHVLTPEDVDMARAGFEDSTPRGVSTCKGGVWQ